MASVVKTSDQPRDNEEKEESSAYAKQLVMGLVLSMAMQSAVELCIFDVIAKAGPGSKLTASEIAVQMSTKNKDAPGMLDRILGLLANHRIPECSADSLRKLFGLAPVSKYFLRNEDVVSFGPVMVLIQDKVFLESWFVYQTATC